MKNSDSSDPKKPLADDTNLPQPEFILKEMSGHICVLNPDGTIAFMNQAMLDFAGIVDVVGKTLADLGLPRELADRLGTQAEKVFMTGKPSEGTVLTDVEGNKNKLICFTLTPVRAADGSVAMAICEGQAKSLENEGLDLWESKERQAFLLRLSDALRPLSNAAVIQQEATRLLGEHLNVDRTYYADCDEARQLAVIEHDYVRNGAPSLVGVHHYKNFEAIVKPIRNGTPFIAFDVLEMLEVQPQLDSYIGNQMRSLVAMPLMKNGEMAACLAITSSIPRRWTPSEISLLEEVAERTWEAVERGRSERALQKKEQLMSTIFESLPVGVGLIEKDGRISLSNQELHRYLPEKVMPSAVDHVATRWQAWDIDGKPLDRNNYPGLRASRGEFILPGIEMLYTPEHGEPIWTQVAAVPLQTSKEGVEGLITVITNIDQIKRTTRALHDTEQQFRAFVATSSELVYRMSADWNQMYNLSGNGFLKDTVQPISNWLESYIPKDEQAHVRSVIANAIQTKSMFELEHRVNQADGSTGWAISRAIPLLDEHGNITEWLGAANDITLRKTTEQHLQGFASRLEQEVNIQTQELKESRDQLQSILDTTLIQMSILQAVRDEKGQIKDLKIMLVNKELEHATKRQDLIGKLYSREYPGIHKTGIYDMIVKTIETGEPSQTEYYYPYEGFNKWFSSAFVKLNDGVVATNMDISAHKLAEEERLKNYLLLKQSEDVAQLGSWDFNLLGGVFSWSDGMYRLFDMKERIEVSPEIYLGYTTESGRPAAERIVRHIREGDADFAETLEININGQIKILQLKATVIRNEQGAPVRVLGVDIDVTASRAAEDKIRQLEIQQQELIFRATLASQEEERRRISESLHNGLGQMLYGIKLSMSHLTIEQAIKKPEMYATDKTYTDQLVMEAIAESRHISHMLMPSTLEDFGLKAAINDICKQLNSEIKFTCQVTGFEGRLDNYIELAVFRIIQELMLNVAKHSGASKAIATARIKDGFIEIKVQDNGRGIPPKETTETGIGLSSIHSKVKLLNGSVTIDSSPGAGTNVLVRMPLSS
jgi:signal transduction histidine kinase